MEREKGDTMTKFELKLATCLSTAFVMIVANPATSFAEDQAAQTASESVPDAGEIVVTARRFDEKLQDVPAAVSVLTAEAIENTGARVAADFVQLTPGVTIVTGNVEAADTQINIRGINGARDAESNVALVVDGIQKSNTSSLNQDQGSVQQIEVLKGPQGALYGRNAAAGAVIITTKKPGNALEGSARVSYGNNETVEAAALLSGPLSDSVGFVINGDYSRSDGHFRNSFLPTDINKTLYPGNSTKAASMDNYERWNVNGRLVFTPSDDTEIDLKGRYGKLRSGAIAFNAAFQIPALEGADKAFNIDINDHKFIFTPNIDPLNTQQTIEASARLTQSLGAVDLIGYVAYSNIKNDFYADGTSAAFGFFANESTCAATAAGTVPIVNQAPFDETYLGGAFVGAQPYSPTSCDGTQYQKRNQEDFSAELRLVGETDALRWQLGGYFLSLDRRTCINLGLDTGQGVVRECYTTDPRNPTEALVDDNFKTKVYAAFGSVDYDVTEAFKIGVALRYDIEDRSTNNNVPTGRLTRWVGNVLTGNPNGTATTPANYYLNPGLDPVYNPSGILADRSQTYKQLQPKVTLGYKVSPDLSLFANWGIGFKSGGFNNGGSQAVIDNFFNATIASGLSIFDDYRKERSSAFEAGFKGRALDGRLTFDVAAYHTTVKDMQFFEFFVGPFGLLRVVSNIDKVRLQGVEGSASFRVIDGWSLFGSFNVTDSKIKRNDARPYTEGNKSPYTADYTLNIGSQIDAPLNDDLSLLVRADYRITGKTWFHTVQDNTVPTIFGFAGNFKNSQRDPYGIFNLRVGVKGESWGISAFAENLFNKKYVAEVIPAPEFGGDFLTAGIRSSYGVELSYKF